jgi:hypothetical protein
MTNGSLASCFRVRPRVAGQRMAGRRDDHQLVAQERDDRQLGVFQRGTDDRQVQLAVQDLLLDASAGADLERDHKTRVLFLEASERRRQEVDADRRAGADAQGAALDATHLLDGDGRLVEHVEHPARIAVQDVSRLGQPDALAEPVQQGRPRVSSSSLTW